MQCFINRSIVEYITKDDNNCSAEKAETIRNHYIFRLLLIVGHSPIIIPLMIPQNKHQQKSQSNQSHYDKRSLSITLLIQKKTLLYLFIIGLLLGLALLGNLIDVDVEIVVV